MLSPITSLYAKNPYMKNSYVNSSYSKKCFANNPCTNKITFGAKAQDLIAMIADLATTEQLNRVFLAMVGKPWHHSDFLGNKSAVINQCIEELGKGQHEGKNLSDIILEIMVSKDDFFNSARTAAEQNEWLDTQLKLYNLPEEIDVPSFTPKIETRQANERVAFV